MNMLVRGANKVGSNQASPVLQRETPTVYPQLLQEYRMNNAPTVDDHNSQQGLNMASSGQSTTSLTEDQRQDLPSVEVSISRPDSEMLPSIVTKTVAPTDEGKKKRGRPKKLILDPETNQYIDSSHEHYKRLNRLLKESSNPPKAIILSELVGKLVTTGSNFNSLNDQTVKQLLEQKDRRGRPRKFPIEQTGVTIRGIRVNGTVKSRKRSTTTESLEEGTKRKRGRPRREQLEMS